LKLGQMGQTGQLGIQLYQESHSCHACLACLLFQVYPEGQRALPDRAGLADQLVPQSQQRQVYLPFQRLPQPLVARAFLQGLRGQGHHVGLRVQLDHRRH